MQTYVLDISDEEREVRDELNQSIRADFAFLSQKLNETSLEVSSSCRLTHLNTLTIVVQQINWTRWTVTDYSDMVYSLRQMQQVKPLPTLLLAWVRELTMI